MIAVLAHVVVLARLGARSCMRKRCWRRWSDRRRLDSRHLGLLLAYLCPALKPLCWLFDLATCAYLDVLFLWWNSKVVVKTKTAKGPDGMCMLIPPCEVHLHLVLRPCNAVIVNHTVLCFVTGTNGFAAGRGRPVLAID